MAKPQRRRTRGVIELVDETSRPGTAAAPTLHLAETFEDLYRRELPRLLVLARALAGDLAAEDLAQESMLVAHHQWSRIRDLESPAGHVRGICARRAVSPVRRRLAERRALRRPAGEPVSTVEPLSEDAARFWAEVRRLPQRQAQATALCYALDLPVGAVATALGGAEGTVEDHLSRARSTLALGLGTTEEPSSDQLARTSGEALRAGTTGDADAGLTDLRGRQARHRRHTGVVAAAGALVAVCAGAAAASLLAHQGDPAPEASRPSASPTGYHFPCQVNRVSCVGKRAYQFDLAEPVRWQIPTGYEVHFGLAVSPLTVQVYRPDGRADVHVLERVRASSPSGEGPAPGVADDPQAFVEWVASRPFLQAGQVVPVEMDGRPAWQVQVRRAPGADPGRGLCDGTRCHALTYQADGTASGLAGDMAAEYTAFHLPGAGTTVVWSRSIDGDARLLSAMDEVVDGLSWPTR